MGIFDRKKKKYDLSDVLDENDFIMDFGVFNDEQQNGTKIKPAHVLTAQELMHQDTNPEQIPMQNGTSAADALKERMSKPAAEPAEKIEMKPQPEVKPEKTEPKADNSDFEHLISRLQELVQDIETTKQEDGNALLTHSDIDDIISVAERRAKQRAEAVYSKRVVLPEQEYPFYNPLADEEFVVKPSEQSSEELKVELEEAPLSNEEPEPPQIHLATDELDEEEQIDIDATRSFDISEEITTDNAEDIYGTREYDAISEETDDIFSNTQIIDDLSDEELEEEEEAPQEEDFPNDYTCIDDAPQIKLNLSHSIRKLSLRTTVCGICSLLLLLFSNALFVELQLSDFTRNIIQIILLAVCGIASSNIIRGIRSIFKGESDVDSVAAVALVLTFLHSLYFAFVSKQAPVIYPEAAIALSLTIFNYGKLLNVRRIYKNFCFVATSNQKNALHFIEKEASVNSIVRGALDGPALICTGRRTVNTGGFFKNTYSCDVQSSISSRLLIISAVVALVVGVLGFAQQGLEFAFTAATLTLSLFAAPATVLVTVLPLKAAADSLEEYNGILPGYSSAFKIRSANVVAVDVCDLFPKGSVKLYNMHTLSKNPVDRSLCEAAAVVMAAKSPLSDIFAQITGSLKENLPAVDSMLYEERLGLSGWVDDRRILIGNRTLMENHNVPIPSYDVDKKILAKGFFPVYIAADSKPCVLLVVGYNTDDNTTYELRRLCNAGYTVMVNSCDPNTSSEMLCDYFGLPDGSIKTMNSDGVRAYKEETNYQESLDTVACYDNSVCGLFALATASMRVPTLSIIMLVLNIISIVVGVCALGCIIFMNAFSLLTPLMVLIYQLISTLVISLMPAIFKP